MEVQRFSRHQANREHPLVKSWWWVWVWHGRQAPLPPVWFLTSCHTVGDWYHPVHKLNYSTTLKKKDIAIKQWARLSERAVRRATVAMASVTQQSTTDRRESFWLVVFFDYFVQYRHGQLFFFASLSQMLLLCNRTVVCTSLNSGCNDFYFNGTISGWGHWGAYSI